MREVIILLPDIVKGEGFIELLWSSNGILHRPHIHYSRYKSSIHSPARIRCRAVDGVAVGIECVEWWVEGVLHRRGDVPAGIYSTGGLIPITHLHDVVGLVGYPYGALCLGQFLSDDAPTSPTARIALMARVLKRAGTDDVTAIWMREGIEHRPTGWVSSLRIARRPDGLTDVGLHWRHGDKNLRPPWGTVIGALSERAKRAKYDPNQIRFERDKTTPKFQRGVRWQSSTGKWMAWAPAGGYTVRKRAGGRPVGPNPVYTLIGKYATAHEAIIAQNQWFANNPGIKWRTESSSKAKKSALSESSQNAQDGDPVGE